MSRKLRYNVDEANRLVITRKNKKLAVSGSFMVSKDNKLIYQFNEPLEWRRRRGAARKLSFQGFWRLNSNYDLEFVIDKAKQESLVLKGKIISVKEDSLVFEIASRNQAASQIYLIKLSGTWCADEYNRINFVLSKKDSPGNLVFHSLWKIDERQQVFYSYEKTDLATKTKQEHILRFEGSWDVLSADRLVYILERSSVSGFVFKVQFQSQNLYPKTGEIKYRIGIGLKGTRNSGQRIITLYGTWKFAKKAALLFMMDYGRGKLRAIEFGIDYILNDKNKIAFSLKKSDNNLGLNVVFTHKLLSDAGGECFLRLFKTQAHSGIKAGLLIPF